MEERFYIKVGNCYVEFIGLFHEAKMRSDYHKASPYLDDSSARAEAKKRGVRDYKVVKKYL